MLNKSLLNEMSMSNKNITTVYINIVTIQNGGVVRSSVFWELYLSCVKCRLFCDITNTNINIYTQIVSYLQL